jgi:UDP-N-acetyl-D-mannosaminuronic acid dehydrogenase
MPGDKIVVCGECRVTDVRTAELSTQNENTCRDVNIAFANLLAFIRDEQKILV